MVVRGGRGGKGNRYYKSKFNVAPKICEMGEEGITREVILNYKLVGNVALVGKPNSGKSSILRCLSNARPRVAGFAFSTKFPIVGVMDVKKEWKDTEENDNTYDASSEDGEEIPDFYSSTEEETYSSEDTNSSIPTDSDLSEYDMESSHSDRNVWSSDDPSELVDDFDEYSSSDESYNAAIYNSDDDEDDGVKFLCGYGYRAAPQLRSLSTGPSGTKGWTDHVPNSTSTKVEDTDNMMPNIQVKRVTTEGVAIDNLKHIPEGTNEASLTEYDTDEDGLNESDDTSRTFGTADDLEDLCGIGSTSEEEPKRQLVIADVPGLIEGASQGRGLGHKFLKHIENCNVLAYVIDASVDNPLNDYMDVRNEIGLFNESLLSRLSLILLNKLDLIDAERAAELVEMFKSECQHDRVYTVSAKTRGNIETVKVAFSHIYKDPIKKPPNKTNTLDISIDPQDDFRRINPRKFKVEKIEEGEFRIKSSYLERKVPMMRFDQRETLDKLRRILRINRIHYKLKRMGVKAGDVIHIGQMSFCVNELAY
ncbi:GTPase family protein [Babesia divergens]|uniref:GTPase family protein n=1 Tax=Babesia divergens TaxID=32595 RepID=A0AAD9GAK8_BABDI|nr:GTPase family protein [Babesia divergens]